MQILLCNLQHHSLVEELINGVRGWEPFQVRRPEQIELFHKSKLHASVPGYEYATAHELIALTSLHFR